MIDKLKKIFNYSKRYYIIGVFKKSDETEYQLLEILFDKNELLIEDRFSSKDFDEIFSEKLSKDYPVILHIESNSIINKVVENKTGYRNELIFKATSSEFHFFEYHQNNDVFISVTRKQNIDDAIKQISDKGIYIIHLTFGPFVMANLLSMIKDYNTISSSNYSLEIRGNKITSFKNNTISHNEYLVNDETFNQNELPLLASFLDYKFPNEAIEFNSEFLAHNLNEFKFKKRFKSAGIFTLLFFLVSLITSHLLMGFYTKSLTEKQSLYAMSQQTSAKINALNEEKDLKKKILNSSGINNKNFLTKYIVDIGHLTPAEITLNSIDVIPSLKKIKSLEKIDFDINSIVVSGESENDNAFNYWLKAMETLSWIKKIDIEKYSQESKRENSFKIIITI